MKFLKILNARKNNQGSEAYLDFDPALLKKYKKSELLAIISMKEKETTRMAKLVNHFKAGMKTREDTIMYLNRQINALKDLLSLELNYNKATQG